MQLADINPASGTSFMSRGRYPKSRERLKDIFYATYDIIVAEGLAGASQEAIAKRAEVTQSAVRHYFPTKEDLLQAFFMVSVERLQSLIEETLKRPNQDHLNQLLEIVGTHYDWMIRTEDVYYFESAAFWGRNPQLRAFRESWYRNLTRYYRDLLAKIHPTWGPEELSETAFQLITLVLGGWSTLGTTRSVYRSLSKKNLKTKLLRGAVKLVS